MFKELTDYLKKQKIKVVKTKDKNEITFNLGDFKVMTGIISSEIDEAYVEVTDTRTDNILSDTVISENEKQLTADTVSVIKSLIFQLEDEYSSEKTLELESTNENEDFGNDIEALLRALISDEQDASSNYLSAAVKLKEKGLNELAALMEDLSNEEIVHVGELQKALDVIGLDSPDLIKDGEKEAADKLENPEGAE